MKRIAVLLLTIFFIQSIWAQNNFRAVVKDNASLELLQGVTVSVKGNSNQARTTDTKGMVEIKNIATGQITFVFSYVGYNTQEISVNIPSFKALWAPIDGRVVNMSGRFKPFEKW